MGALDQLSPEEIQETSMIDIIYHFLEEKREPETFGNLMKWIVERKDWTEEQTQRRYLQAYTDLNIDGRFVALGDNHWGLSKWYPFEQTQEELVTTYKPAEEERAIDDDADLDDDFDDDFEDIDKLGGEDDLDLDTTEIKVDDLKE